ncbi:MAG TPA: sigma-70 family RNA polymerase sigma factor [Ramlibacter sp.]|nr:sigma-70 family RNA polymerase sigma factor [Ramlibacter sp.]
MRLSGRTPTDDELHSWISAVAVHHDPAAFAALFRHFGPRIKSYLIRGGALEQNAEELVQETMVVLWRRAAAYDQQRAPLSAWVYTIARHLHVDQRRHAAVDAVAAVDHNVDVWDSGHQVADDHASPDELLAAVQRAHVLRRALAELPADQAFLLQRFYCDEYPHAAIAREMGIPVGALKSRIRTALAHMRRKVDRI